ncbi:MAG: ACP S-malonyltransferase [Acidobacteria bacterium]|nr:ACP S-malonyltransferase [Acidobacteriota bacterium]MCB9396426.1 ACP S-malonyltransferase [Acidobacteriota bacterium]
MARIVVVAPGRGSYNRSELGYFARFSEHPAIKARKALLQEADTLRQKSNQITISQLDGAENYQASQHLPGENASALIFSCSAADYLLLQENHQICAVLGNSMGWYTTLFTGGCLDFRSTFHLVNSMGLQQAGNIRGGQIIYPIVDAEWRVDPQLEKQIFQILEEISAQGSDFWVGLSIRLGGFLVLAGTDAGIKQALQALPKLTLGSNEYPFQLSKHAAFHTPIMDEASSYGLMHLARLPFQQPTIPMIDGRGYIWRPYQSAISELTNYTFGHQVTQPFDFTTSVRVALREYNPDHLVLLGPGESLGGSIGQIFIEEGWRGIRSKSDFMAAQKSAHPPLIAMNRVDQAQLIL